MMIQLRFNLHGHPRDADIRAVFESLGRTQCESLQTVRAVHLDTFDWRLYRVGYRLTWEQSGGRRTVRFLPSPEASSQVVPTAAQPRWAEDLPSATLRSLLAEILDVRALLPLGATTTEHDLYRVEDEDGNTRLRVWRERVTADAADGSAQLERSMLRLENPGDAGELLDRAIALIADHLEAEPAPLDDLELAATTVDRHPGDYSSKISLELEPDVEAADALRQILLSLHESMHANVDGVLRDLDVEFLHDLRVATRRTRSALGQLQGILTPTAVRPFTDDFRWLGSVTGPCRDLDVYLIELQQSIDMLPETVAAALEPLAPILSIARADAHREVVKALRSRRFRSLKSRWSAFLSTNYADAVVADLGSRPIRQIADERIHKAYRRIVKRGVALGDDPPAQALHRLRIDAKKLRYLLEFFKTLYPEELVQPRIRTLKQLQDVLGGFQDMEVQRERLESFGERVLASDTCTATTLLAMGELASVLRARQESFRLAFGDRFTPFASVKAQDEWRELCGAHKRTRRR